MHAYIFTQAALRRRDALQLEYENACDERSRKKKAHDDVSACVLQ